MDVSTVLQQCEKLTHNERMEFMYNLGREAISDASKRDVLTQLHRGSPYERFLGLQTVHGSRNVSTALEAFQSPSRILKERAYKIIASLGTDDDILEALRTVPSYLRIPFIKRLHGRRRKVLDAYCADLSTSAGAEDQVVLNEVLAFASSDTVKRLLPGVLDSLGSLHAYRIANRHAEVTYTVVRDRLLLGTDHFPAEPTPYDTANRLLVMIKTFFGTTHSRAHGRHIWDLALDIVTILSASIHLSRLGGLPHLVRERPRELAQLYIDKQQKPVSENFSSVLDKLSMEQIFMLEKLMPAIINVNGFLTLAEDKRSAVYRLKKAEWQTNRGSVSIQIVSALPIEERLAEARRHVNCATAIWKDRGHVVLPYAALLPWEEAMVTTKSYLHSNDASIRSKALVAQIESTRLQAGVLSNVLGLLLQRAHELDPVRLSCLQALQSVPLEQWKEENLMSLARIIRDALDANDLSTQSVEAMLAVVTQLLQFHPQWASKQLALIIEERRQIPKTIPLIRKRFLKGTMMALSDGLRPALEALLKHDPSFMVSMAAVLKENLPYFPYLLNMLEQVLGESRSPRLALEIWRIFSRVEPERLQRLVPQLLDADPRWIAFPPIEVYAKEHKLAAYMSVEEHKGRFDITDTAQDMIVQHQFPWSMTKQEQETDLAKCLVSLEDEDASMSTWRVSIHKIAALCWTDAKHLINYASDERALVRETAISSLGRLDGGQGIPTLLEALGDDRGRFAIYALSSFLKTTAKDEFLRILESAPMKKVTVAKEVIRLLAELDTRDAHSFLVRLGQKDLHPDALRTLLSHLEEHITSEEVFDIYRRAAAQPNGVITGTVIQCMLFHEPFLGQKLTSKLRTREEFLEQRSRWRDILFQLLSNSAPECRIKAIQHCPQCPDPDGVFVDVLSGFATSGSTEESRSATSAIVAMYSIARPAEVQRLLMIFRDNSRKLESLVTNFAREMAIQRGKQGADTIVAIVEPILDILASTPLTTRLQLDIIFRGLPRSALLANLQRLGPSLHADALARAEKLTEEFRLRKDDLDLLQLEADLAQSSHEALRRLGLCTVLAQAGRKEGWTQALRRRLDVYRRDASALVAEAATFVFPPESVEA
ncbi:MAG: hypothetical protein M1818_002535 [Claussenomyces sp. TS43310]|nr:MAG: hypothetical protein M1818_002535 [Claussenomyces sp. TS43310]